MSTLLKTLGYITGYASVSYLTLTSMMQDPNKPYRGHLNIRTDDRSKNSPPDIFCSYNHGGMKHYNSLAESSNDRNAESINDRNKEFHTDL